MIPPYPSYPAVPPHVPTVVPAAAATRSSPPVSGHGFPHENGTDASSGLKALLGMTTPAPPAPDATADLRALLGIGYLHLAPPPAPVR